MEEMKNWDVTPDVQFIGKFHDSPYYLDAVIDSAKGYDHREYDHVLFSFHGLPERHIHKSDAHYGDGNCKLGACCEMATKGNQYCYRANCFQTANAVAGRLNIPKEKYSVAFQSRLGRDPWIKPYSDHQIIEWGKSGKKRILAFSLSFVADCLETTHEIGTEYHELFREHGGEKIQLVGSLNSSDAWVEAVKKMIS
jgi:ferrochelatase